MPPESPIPPAGPTARRLRAVALAGGPLLALAAWLLLPDSYAALDGRAAPLTPAARATIAMMVWMAVWWMAEAVPIEATALLPVALFPVLGVASLPAATAPYASDVVFLFLGGLLLAQSIQRWGLDRRIAWNALRFAGTKPDRVVGAMMAVTAGLSMWMSNTACAAVMIPVAIGLIRVAGGCAPAEGAALAGGAAAADAAPPSRDERHFATALLLGIAYAASIGGIATLVGSPPNALAARFLEQSWGIRVSFAGWMAVGLPAAACLLPLAWLLLTRLHPCRMAGIAGGAAHVRAQARALGPPSRAEWLTLATFAATAVAWILRPLLGGVELGGVAPFAALGDAGIAMLAAIVLFVLPAGDGSGRRVLDWRAAQSLPWGVLVLMGGGLSLAAAVQANDVTGFIGSQAGALQGLSPWIVVAVAIAVAVFLSELTSNTAQVATMLPILAALAPALGVPGPELLVGTALAASCAFMLPVGTPPNALVFATGRVTIGQMCRAGLGLNLIAIAVLTVLANTIVGWAFGR